ncbi:hypothetical protein Dimus_026655 [Dionaea muscipula]
MKKKGISLCSSIRRSSSPSPTLRGVVALSQWPLTLVGGLREGDCRMIKSGRREGLRFERRAEEKVRGKKLENGVYQYLRMEHNHLNSDEEERNQPLFVNPSLSAATALLRGVVALSQWPLTLVGGLREGDCRMIKSGRREGLSFERRAEEKVRGKKLENGVYQYLRMERTVEG